MNTRVHTYTRVLRGLLHWHTQIHQGSHCWDTRRLCTLLFFRQWLCLLRNVNTWRRAKIATVLMCFLRGRGRMFRTGWTMHVFNACSLMKLLTVAQFRFDTIKSPIVALFSLYSKRPICQMLHFFIRRDKFAIGWAVSIRRDIVARGCAVSIRTAKLLERALMLYGTPSNGLQQALMLR